MLVKSSFLPMIPLSLIWAYLILPDRARGMRLAMMALVAVGTVLPITPWTARNYMVHHQLVTVSTNTGSNLNGGNNPLADGGFTPGYPYIIPGYSETESDRLLTKAAIDYIRAEPGAFLALIPKILIKLFAVSEFGTSGQFPSRFALLANVFHLLFLLLCIISAVLTRRRIRLFLHGYLLVITKILTSVVFFGATRFQLPLAPVLAILASVGLAHCLRPNVLHAAMIKCGWLKKLKEYGTP